MSTVLVTGGSGYLGTQLIAALLRDGRQVADLTADDGWKAAMAGCEEVHHVASPIPAVQPADPDELTVPAREGTLRVLRAARDAGARRVVLTSSFAAIGYTPKPGAEFTEDDWTDPDTPGLPPYPRSKVIAERAAWDLMEHDGGDTELAGLHIRAMAVREAPGEDPPRLVIHNDRAREELGWRPRPAEETIVQTAESLRDLGLLKLRCGQASAAMASSTGLSGGTSANSP